MRRAILLVLIAVLAVVVLPGLGIGLTAGKHGGTPSDVFMNTHAKKCLGVMSRAEREAMPTSVTVGADSHLIVNFTSEWGGLDAGAEGLLALGVTDPSGAVIKRTSFTWSVAGAETTRTSASAMWTFTNVPPGDYTVGAFARVDLPPGSPHRVTSLNDCALTVLVSPVA